MQCTQMQSLLSLARSRPLLPRAAKKPAARAALKAHASSSVPLLHRDYTLRVTLQPRDDKQAFAPWRLLRVRGGISLDELAQKVLVPAMGWSGGHLYVFESAEGSYMLPEDEGEEPTDEFEEFEEGSDKDATKAHLCDVLNAPGDTMSYVYDLGDNWAHTVKLESVAALSESVGGVELLDGGLACPPEDLGYSAATSYEAALAAASAVAMGDASAARKLARCRAAAAGASNYSPFFAVPDMNCAGSLDLYPVGFDVLEARKRFQPDWQAVRDASSEAEQHYLRVRKMAKALETSTKKH